MTKLPNQLGHGLGRAGKSPFYVLPHFRVRKGAHPYKDVFTNQCRTKVNTLLVKNTQISQHIIHKTWRLQYFSSQIPIFLSKYQKREIPWYTHSKNVYGILKLCIFMVHVTYVNYLTTKIRNYNHTNRNIITKNITTFGNSINHKNT